tara:strand:- start:314 stop:568 length:255 start_codon:yes stop_codon:yes gene_type:complete
VPTCKHESFYSCEQTWITELFFSAIRKTHVENNMRYMLFSIKRLPEQIEGMPFLDILAESIRVEPIRASSFASEEESTDMVPIF